MTTLSDKLDALALLAEAATPGPWFDDYGKVGAAFTDSGVGEMDAQEDAAFIVALRNIAPELLAVVRAAERITPPASAESMRFARLRAALDNLEAKL